PRLPKITTDQSENACLRLVVVGGVHLVNERLAVQNASYGQADQTTHLVRVPGSQRNGYCCAQRVPDDIYRSPACVVIDDVREELRIAVRSVRFVSFRRRAKSGQVYGKHLTISRQGWDQRCEIDHPFRHDAVHQQYGGRWWRPLAF